MITPLRTLGVRSFGLTIQDWVNAKSKLRDLFGLAIQDWASTESKTMKVEKPKANNIIPCGERLGCYKVVSFFRMDTSESVGF